MNWEYVQTRTIYDCICRHKCSNSVGVLFTEKILSVKEVHGLSFKLWNAQR
jgi:hypothetical protein